MDYCAILLGLLQWWRLRIKVGFTSRFGEKREKCDEEQPLWGTCGSSGGSASSSGGAGAG